MDLLGKEVKHKKFGKGIITDFTQDKVTVCFSENDKLFVFPDAFTQYLTIKDDSIQNEINKMNREKGRANEENKQVEKSVTRKRNPKSKIKTTLKLQAAYNIKDNDMDDINQIEYIETGRYLSGEMKGKAKIPSSVQANSTVILTSCGDSDEEKRLILGLTMVDSNAWDDECKDGKIVLHKKYKLILPDENRPSFWGYFNRESFPLHWGKVPFKYFQNSIMQNIILDLCDLLEGTEQEEAALEFYQRFCYINNLPETR